MRYAMLLLCSVLASAADDDATARIRASWISIDETLCLKPLAEGQKFDVAIDYNLSAAPAATLVLSGHGPWIDLPDGTYETKRHHADYQGLSASVEVKPGRGRQVFSFTVPKLTGRDSILWIARFRDAGKDWPCETRLCSGALVQADPPLRLTTAMPGNVFTYTEPVRFTVGFGSKASPGSDAVLAWRVVGRDGSVVTEGAANTKVPAAGTTVPLVVPCERRGVLGLHVTVDGVGSADASFARIPDVLAITKGEATRFGFHDNTIVRSDVMLDANFTMARRLGLTFCRQFVSWRNLEPARGEWRLDGLDRALSKGKEHGIGMMMCLMDPPAWVMTRRVKAGYEPFAFDEAGWQDAITTMARRFKGRLAAWEWLNEIVPGPEEDPIATYLAMVRLGNAAAKAEDPAVLSVLAGGLWPRSFRLGLLAAGIGRHIDVLPVHYSDGAGISEALGDLNSVSAGNVQVWDDETATGTSSWRMPLAGTMAQTDQRAHAMNRFPGELTAGAQRILWFGQGSDAAGNWDFAWPDGSPRPVAATLAMLSSKLHRAQPQGSFAIGDSGRFNLFAVDGKAVLVAPASKVSRPVRVGSASVIVTDDQGEESRVEAQGIDVALPAGLLPVFVEGCDLDVLRGYTAPELLSQQVGLLAGQAERLRVRLTNRSDKPLACTLIAVLPDGWKQAAAVVTSLAAGENRSVEIGVTAPADAASGDFRLNLECSYDDARMPRVSLPWQLSVIDPKRLGNLLVDGDLESGGGGWTLAASSRIEAVTGFTEGLGGRSLHLFGPEGWKSVSQALALAPGRPYLYSAWMRVGSQKQSGSNIDQHLKNGSVKTMYIPHVFSAANLPEWQFLTKVYQAPDDLVKAIFAPVTQGEAYYDNIRVTTYEGTNYAAEAARVAKPPLIDGQLSEWGGGCPIPLLGPGQTTVYDKSWKSGQDNLRGVVKLSWDRNNLYLAAWVDDDVLAAPETGDRTISSDSLVLALHPTNRVAGEDGKAFCYYLSPASPGGGSGTSTLYRPVDHSGGLASGQLAKDSSVYELAVRRDGARTLYEARLPWSELGTAGRLGLKLGCTLQLNDNDGNGRAASISWGNGLEPSWAPSAFGVVTLVE